MTVSQTNIAFMTSDCFNCNLPPADEFDDFSIVTAKSPFSIGNEVIIHSVLTSLTEKEIEYLNTYYSQNSFNE